MNENDFSEIVKNISQMVNDGNIPDEMKNIINSFSSNSSSQNNDSSSNASNSLNFDIETIIKMKSIFDKLNDSDDPRANLLRSLKPYLKDSRKSKIDQYIQLFNISKVIDILNPNGGDVAK